jgi:uncharacterized protein YndB with AHSA1/START domain
MDIAPVHASMLIQRPVGEVFAAFVNPQQLRKFWLSDSTGPLGPRARVQWSFMVPGATARVTVTRFESPHHLSFDWDDEMHVSLTFEAFGDGGTKVGVEVTGFSGADSVEQATNTVEGFAIVLCDLKTLLETGESAGLVRAKAGLIVAAQAARGG